MSSAHCLAHPNKVMSFYKPLYMIYLKIEIFPSSIIQRFQAAYIPSTSSEVCEQ